jgi:electron transfer flavoprotein alpha subunit
MKALVWIDLVDGLPSDDALSVLARLRALGIEAWAILCGHGLAKVAAAVSRYDCAGVLVADADVFAALCAEATARFIAGVMRDREIELFGAAASVFNVELAARLAVHADAGILWGLTSLRIEDDQLIAARATHCDAMLCASGWTTKHAIALFRQHDTATDEPGAATAAIFALETSDVSTVPLTSVTPIAATAGSAAALADAEIVVSGGRGIGQRENLALIHDLADALGGVAGVSLPLVDMGWAPRAMQVGQTGTVIAPRLYVACGISGQIQHKVGVERSGTIVAINTDRDAPIMKFCDLGIIGDVKLVLPALISAVRNARSHGALPAP